LKFKSSSLLAGRIACPFQGRHDLRLWRGRTDSHLAPRHICIYHRIRIHGLYSFGNPTHATTTSHIFYSKLHIITSSVHYRLQNKGYNSGKVKNYFSIRMPFLSWQRLSRMRSAFATGTAKQTSYSGRPIRHIYYRFKIKIPTLFLSFMPYDPSL